MPSSSVDVADARLDPHDEAATPWYRALTLDERMGAGMGMAAYDVASVDRGGERWSEWLEAIGHPPYDLIQRRLAMAELSIDAWYALLGENSRELAARARPSSPVWLEAMLADLASGDGIDALPTWAGAPPNAGLVRLVEPLLAAGHARLVDQLASSVEAAAIPVADLLRPIRHRLLTLVERPMILELHAAHLLGQLPEGTPHELYAAFVERLAVRDSRLDLLQTYPVLARLAWEWVDQWRGNVVELVAALDADRAQLDATFGELGPVVALMPVSSDPHRGGRHVWFVDFETETRLVFKPRPFEAEVGFQKYVAALDARAMRPQLRTLGVVSSGDHGWLEHVVTEPSSGANGLREFHRRQGAWLVVLWTLAGTDVHYENVLAAGDHPVPIDHETLLRSRLFAPAPHDADLLASEWLADSVDGVNMLPAPRWDAGLRGVIDQAGMGDGYDQAGEIAVPRVVDAGSADMRIDVGPIVPERQRNRARLEQADVDPRGHVEAIEEGFVAAWRHIQAHREDALAAIEDLDGSLVRMVLRPTHVYQHVLDALGHPEYLQDATERERALLQLWAYAEDQGWRAATVESERRQLLAGDVPWFGTESGSWDVLGGDGSRIEGAVVRRGLDVARERIVGMDDDALAEQLWVLRASLASWEQEASVAGRTVAGDPREAADEIVQRVLAASVPAQGQRSWLGLHVVDGGEVRGGARFRPAPISSDVYEGLAGVALLLAAHGRVAGLADSLIAAREAAATLVDRGVESVSAIGAYDGAAGIAWAAMQLALWLDDSSLLDVAESAAQAVARLTEHDRTYDIIGGVAGCIPVLVELGRHRPGYLDIAVHCGEHLAAHVVDAASLSFARGCAHGLAGVAWSLGRLAAATGDERWLVHACALADVEDTLLVGGAWTDAAHDLDGDHMAAWCHGAPGIALARLDLARVSGRDRDWESGRAALAASTVSPACDSHGLCHGELGMVDVFAVAAVLDPSGGWEAERDRRAQAVLAQLHADGPRCTTPRHLSSPGLMTGLSGIGWGLLRLVDPETVPTLLLPGTVAQPDRAVPTGEREAR